MVQKLMQHIKCKYMFLKALGGLKLTRLFYSDLQSVGFGGSYLSDGSSTWLTTKSLSTLVLNKKTSDFMIEGLDFSNTLIKYQGIELFGKP